MKNIVLVIFVFITAGCSAVDITAYRDQRPELDLFRYFEGDTRGWGIVQDRKGTLLRHFVVDIKGRVTDQGQLILNEDFVWSDGEESTRIWVLDRHSTHTFTGTADDVVGDAAGVSYGNVLNWRYRLNLRVDDSTWKITFDDWMFQVDEKVLINRATMSKFGVTVGEVTIAFRKSDSDGGTP